MIRERLLQEMFFTRGLRGLLLLFALLLLPSGTWGQTSIKVAGNEPDAEGYINGDGIIGSITFDASTNTLTLEDATLTGAIESSLSNLTIYLKGNNRIKGTDESNKLDNGIFSTVATAKLAFTSIVSEGKPTGKLFFQYVTKPIDGFSSSNITYNNGLDQGFVYDNQGASYLGIGEIEYGLSIGEIKVTSANYSNIIVGGNSIGSYDKAATHILTLNGATLTVPISWDNDENFTIELKGTNSITVDGSCITTTVNGKNISFKRGGACSLELSAGTASVISGFSNCENPTMDTRLYWFPTYGATDNISSAIVTSSLLSGGAGTSGSPFEIKDFDDLKNFATYVNEGILTTEYVKLKDNITCGTGFVPIGNSDYAFTGNFDGDGKTISGLQYENRIPDVSIGLFERINGGTVKNLTLSGCSFSGGTKTGAIVGYFQAGTIQNCKVSSTTIESGDANIGAIVGYKEDAAVLSNNYYDADVTVSKTVGGTTTTKSGYDQRGIGNGGDVVSNNGAVLYTRELTITGFTDDSEATECYAPLSDAAKGEYYFIPDKSVTIYLYPPEASLISTVTLNYTPTGASKPTVQTLENTSTSGGYAYTFNMPDATASFNVTMTQDYDGYLAIGGVKIEDDYSANGSTGTIAYSKNSKTITLTNYTGTFSTNAIEIGIEGLKVKLVGTNSITCSNGYAFKGLQNAASVEFIREDNGYLMINTGNAFDGFAAGKVTYEGLICYSSGDTQWTIKRPAKPYLDTEHNDTDFYIYALLDYGIEDQSLSGGVLYSNQGPKLKYSYDYVGTQTDIKGVEYSDESIRMTAPGVLTAWVEVGEVKSEEVTGVRFGLTDIPVKAVYDGTATTCDISIEPVSKLTGFTVALDSKPGFVTDYSNGKLTINGCGKGSFSLRFTNTAANGPGFVVLGDTAVCAIEVIPAKPTISLASGTYDEGQTVELSSNIAGAIIKYYFGDMEPATPETYDSSKPLTLTEDTKLTAWVEVNGMMSETVSATYTITEYTSFEDPFSNADQVWCTYVSTSTVDKTLPENLEAYIVTSVGESSVDITSVGYLPKGVPLLLKRTGNLSGAKVKTYTGSAGSFTDNKLQAVPAGGVDVSTIASIVYVLYDGDFVKCTSGTIPAGKCYLVVSSPSAARVLIIGDATIIDNLHFTIDNKAGAVYDLQGRKLSFGNSQLSIKKGLYIVNGKKVVIK